MIQKNEYNSYYQYYIEKSYTDNLIEGFNKSQEEFISFIKEIPEEKLSYAYENGKWTIAEVLLHIIDTERIFGYRALRFSRNDQMPIEGFEQDDYVINSNASDFSKDDLLENYLAVRNHSKIMFKSFTNEMLLRKGTASNSPMSTRAAGYIMIGHQQHHIEVINNKYF